ncbi:UNVERIFIED_CONTAM: hypothetical protein HDU68_011058 [Siphonaria sp. JEL0065]|nr:hypothetical protein HDU68_011058 [Siphonaria sp. JEL0065]
MGKFFDALEDHHREFIAKQKIYFVATSSLKQGTRVNVSPKGHETLRVIGNKAFHLDLTGSGAETAAHVAENGRVTFMLCAFDGAPNIIRLWCNAKVVLAPNAEEFDQLVKTVFPDWVGHKGLRSIVVADIMQVGSSCGYAVPFFDFVKQRDTLVSWANKKTDEEIQQYWVDRNSKTIDGLSNLGSEGFDASARHAAKWILPSLQQLLAWSSLVAVGVVIGQRLKAM